ncbi:MAG: hypothetical protein FWG77_02305 [Treponema sp.]|nr:hypothetical protein [Treponema sp.]
MARKNLLTKLLSRSLDDAPPPELPELKFVFFIIDWNQAQALSDIFNEHHVRFHFLTKGVTGYSSDILDLLGIDSSDKAVICCLEQAVLFPLLVKDARKKQLFNSPGQGLAFTIPLSAINDPILLIFKESIYKNKDLSAIKPGKKGGKMAKKYSHDLIVSIINHGSGDEFMNTARAAGASGGTVMHARGQAHDGAVKFFGISVQDEKDIIFILTSREKKAAIMQAVSEAHGLNSEAHGIIFSVPADDVTGLDFE